MTTICISMNFIAYFEGKTLTIFTLKCTSHGGIFTLKCTSHGGMILEVIVLTIKEIKAMSTLKIVKDRLKDKRSQILPVTS